MKKVALYCLPTSPEYPMTREFLAQHNIPFDTYLLDTEDQITAQTGQAGKLQLVVYETNEQGQFLNPQVIVGFDKEMLIEVLGQ